MKFILTCLLTFSITAFCNPWGFPETKEVQGRQLVLNGIGMRTKFWVEVYTAALYLPEKTQKTDIAKTMEGPKVVSFYFLRDVSKDQISNSWIDSYGMDRFPTEVAALNSHMVDIRENTNGIEFQIHDDGLLLKVNGANKTKIQNKAFADAVLDIYLGPRPPGGSGIKKGMLGRN